MKNQTPNTSIELSVRAQLDQYFSDLGGSEPRDVLAMVIDCVERPVLQIVLDRTNGNQSRAAEILGITRTTLRRKLARHNIQPGSN